MSALAADLAPRAALRASDHVPCDGPAALACAAVAIETRAGHRLVIVAKLTLRIGDGDAAEIADEPHPLGGDVFLGAPFESSLRCATDFAPVKPNVDVTLTGTVRRTKNAKRAEISFAFGAPGGVTGFVRRASIFGARRFDALGRLGSQVDPIGEVPLVYERASGGPTSSANPVGLGEGDLAPQIEDPKALVARRGQGRAPVCFGPIAPTWPARWSRLGTFDPAWTANGWPNEPLDHDPAFHQHAPDAQQLPSVRGDERFVISGVASEEARISGALPGLRVEARVTRTSGATEALALRIDTVSFDADAGTVDLVYRGHVDSAVPCARDVRSVRLTLLSAMGAGIADAEVADDDPFADEPDLRRAVGAEPGPSRDELEALLAAGASLVGANLHGGRFAGIDLRGADLSGADLSGADLREARLSGANLERADLGDADLTDADLSGARGAHVRLEGARLAGANLERAVLPSAVFTRADLEGARLASSELGEARMYGARARGADLHAARLDGLRAEGACFDGANLDDAVISGGVLDGATFVGARLKGARLDDAGLRGASLERADLTRASFVRARLSEAKLSGARAANANWMEAELDRAALREADLRGGNLYGADVRGADLEGARLDHARLAGTRLARAR